MVRWVRAGFPFKRWLGGGHGLAPLIPERHFSKDSFGCFCMARPEGRGRGRVRRDCAWTDSGCHSKVCYWRACWRPNVRRGSTLRTSRRWWYIDVKALSAKCARGTLVRPVTVVFLNFAVSFLSFVSKFGRHWYVL